MAIAVNICRPASHIDGRGLDLAAGVERDRTCDALAGTSAGGGGVGDNAAAVADDLGTAGDADIRAAGA